MFCAVKDLRAIIAAMMKVRGAALAPAHVSMWWITVVYGPQLDAHNISTEKLMGAFRSAPIQGISLVATAIAQETGNVYSQEDKAQLAFNHYSNLLGTSPMQGGPVFICQSDVFRYIAPALSFQKKKYIFTPSWAIYIFRLGVQLFKTLYIFTPSWAIYIFRLGV
ncbi:hypothetical protein ACJX0J_031608, partial [Zea mays]